jgi:hypothetical protein
VKWFKGEKGFGFIAVDGGVNRVQPELELGDDAEVAAAAAQRPEQVRLGVGRGAHDSPVGEHLCVPETLPAAADLPIRRRTCPGIISRWR